LGVLLGGWAEGDGAAARDEDGAAVGGVLAGVAEEGEEVGGEELLGGVVTLGKLEEAAGTGAWGEDSN
jgi:hypothetical protein